MIACSNLRSDSASKPSFVKSSMRLSLSSRRKTIFSPNKVGQVLINGVSKCSVEGADSGICAEGLTLTSRLDVELLG